jgi:hypothetical protein
MHEASDAIGLPVETVRRAVWWAEYKAAALRRNDGRFLARMEQRLQAKVLAGLEKQRAHVMACLANLSVFRAKGVHRVERKALDDELKRLLDGLPSEEIAASLVAAAGLAMLKGARTRIKKNGLAKLGIAFDLANQRAVQYLSGLRSLHLSDRQGSIDKYTKERIVAIIHEGVASGSTYTEMGKLIQDQGDEGVFSPARAQGIAVYETGQAYEYGNRVPMMEAEQRTGDKVLHHWITGGDDKVTEECAANEDQGWIPIEVPFKSGHDNPPRYPNVNCRCTTGYEFASVLHGEE